MKARCSEISKWIIFPKTLITNVTTQTKGESTSHTNLKKGKSSKIILSACDMASVFGNISPNIKIKKVINIMAKGNPLSPKRDTAMDVAMALAAMFTKLLPINVTVKALCISSIAQDIALLLLGGFLSFMASSLPLPVAVIEVSEAENTPDNIKQRINK